MSLVADYDSNSDSYNSSSSSIESETSDNSKKSSLSKKDSVNQLPSASTIFKQDTSKSGEVFNNPYRTAEDAKNALLEKHVKMVKKDEHLTEKNGRKICWNYRKGKCRFGSNCSFAHDSDLSINPKEINKKSVDVGNKQHNIPNVISSKSKQDLNSGASVINKKRRPGLSNSIVPSKRVMKSYNNQLKCKSHIS